MAVAYGEGRSRKRPTAAEFSTLQPSAGSRNYTNLGRRSCCFFLFEHSVPLLYCDSPFVVSLFCRFFVCNSALFFSFSVHCVVNPDWILTLSIKLLCAMSSVQNSCSFPLVMSRSLFFNSEIVGIIFYEGFKTAVQL